MPFLILERGQPRPLVEQPIEVRSRAQGETVPSASKSPSQKGLDTQFSPLHRSLCSRRLSHAHPRNSIRWLLCLALPLLAPVHRSPHPTAAYIYSLSARHTATN